jgi:hypothetical protein
MTSLSGQFLPGDRVHVDFAATDYPYERVVSDGTIETVGRTYAIVDLEYEGGTRMRVPLADMQLRGNPPFVIFSKSERGYWNNTHGWGPLDSATRFAALVRSSMSMPMTKQNDARWKRAPL